MMLLFVLANGLASENWILPFVMYSKIVLIKHHCNLPLIASLCVCVCAFDNKACLQKSDGIGFNFELGANLGASTDDTRCANKPSNWGDCAMNSSKNQFNTIQFNGNSFGIYCVCLLLCAQYTNTQPTNTLQCSFKLFGFKEHCTSRTHKETLALWMENQRAPSDMRTKQNAFQSDSMRMCTNYCKLNQWISVSSSSLFFLLMMQCVQLQ